MRQQFYLLRFFALELELATTFVVVLGALVPVSSPEAWREVSARRTSAIAA